MNLNIPYEAKTWIALAVSLLAGYLVLRLLNGLVVEKGAVGAIKEMTAQDRRSTFDKWGDALLIRLNLKPAEWSRKLSLAQINGEYLDRTIGGVFARCVLYGSAPALFYLMGSRDITTLMMIPGAFYLPLMQLNRAAKNTERKIARLIPEACSLIAAEIGGGSNAAQALERASDIPGPIGKMISHALDESLRSGLSLLSSGAAKGVFVPTLMQYGVSSISRFAVQIDRIADKGVDAPRIMSEVARGFTRQYKKQVDETVSTLDTRLLIPLAFFYFIPFMLTLVPLFLSGNAVW
ncbi:MAG: type II secretion system F family protein [Anaerolineaceae bacterium]|nr:type II secretion system F family protein [Anaerolineaceae bacterium]